MLDTVQGVIDGFQARLEGFDKQIEGRAQIGPYRPPWASQTAEPAAPVNIPIEGGARIRWAMRVLREAGIDFSQDGRTLTVAPGDHERAAQVLGPVQGYQPKGRGPGIRFGLGFGLQAGIAIEDRVIWGLAILSMVAGGIILFAQGVLA